MTHLQLVVEQIRRDTETLAEKEFPREIWPSREFFENRIREYREYARKLQDDEVSRVKSLR